MRTSLRLTLGLIALAVVSTACPTGEDPHRQLSRQAEAEAKAREGAAPVTSPEPEKARAAGAGEEAAHARHHRPPRPDAGSTSEPGGTPTDGHPAPQGCINRPADVTEMDAQVQVDTYGGIQHGKNGDHEIFEGTLTSVTWTTQGKVVDTKNVHVAMNVASAIDKAGLPKELPLKPGQVIELEGEYIPASKANAKNAKGPAAVLHFTHTPCGYAVIDGKKYQ